MTGIFLSGGENGVVEEIFGDEIWVSYNFMPGFGDAPESDLGFRGQPRQYFEQHVLRQIR
jgi:hypothetical protein